MVKLGLLHSNGKLYVHASVIDICEWMQRSSSILEFHELIMDGFCALTC